MNRLYFIFLSIAEYLVYNKWLKNGLAKNPIKSIEIYKNLIKSAEQTTYNNPDIDAFESSYGFKANREWIAQLANKTQVVVKKSPLNYAHGRLLYSALRSYIQTMDSKPKKVSIFDIGTARGFSAICMAKALMDSGIDGTVHTFDPIPHTKKVYWNSITDHQEGKLTREELLTEWGGLIEQYIVFHNGFSKFLLPKIHVGRINFAFLDASRRYKDVVFDLDMVKKHQKRGDIIIVDDYNKVQFSGVVKAVDQLCAAGSYEKRILNSFSARSYAVLKRLY